MAQTQQQLLERQTLAMEAIATALTYIVTADLARRTGNEEEANEADLRAVEHLAAWVGRKPAETPPA